MTTQANNDHETTDDVLKRITSIYSINRKFRAQLINRKEGGWICQIWSVGYKGDRDRPLLRNVQPFATMEEAIQMAQKCFAEYTGDDRYWAKET